MICLISDFDGTLYDGNFNKNLKSIKEFMSNKNVFIIATGRTFKSIKNKINEFMIPYDFLICSDGAVIYDKMDNVIYSKYISNDLKKMIISDLKDKKIKLMTFDNNFEITDNINENISRILIKTYNEETTCSLIKEVSKKYVDLMVYKSTNWINISTENKVDAIKYLERIIKAQKIYVIGDSCNDVKMLEEYDGYVVRNNTLNKGYKVVNSVEHLINLILSN